MSGEFGCLFAVSGTDLSGERSGEQSDLSGERFCGMAVSGVCDKFLIFRTQGASCGCAMC